MHTYQMAIIGYGGMGRWHEENVSLKIPAIKVKGIYDLQDTATEHAKERGLQVYPSVEAILEDQAIDLVVIATPNDSHKDYIIKALQAGKHVVCEKPVTMNVTELEQVLTVAEHASGLFTVHQNRRYDKDFRIIKHLLKQGQLGRPYFVESRVQGSRGAMHGWRGHRVNGGGMVLDWGVHLLDQLLLLDESPVVSVDAHLFNLYSDEVEDNIKIYLRFESGLSAVCEMSTNCLINQPRWHVSGLEGTVVVEDWSCNGHRVVLKADSELAWADEIVYTEAGPTRTMAPRPAFTTEVHDLPEIQTDWTDFYQNVAQVMAGEAELIVRPEQVLRVMKVIDTVFESQRLGTGIKCHT